MVKPQKFRDQWRVQIRRKGEKPISKVFATKALADRYIKEQGHTPEVTIGKMIRTYRVLKEKSGNEVLDTSNEHYTLKRLEAEFDDLDVTDLDTQRLVEFAQMRQAEKAGPYTVNMDISKLGTVIRHTKDMLGVKVGDPVQDARPTLHHFKLIGGGGKRERRPTADEIVKLFEWFKANLQYKTPMEDMIRVGIMAAFRRGELCKIKWADIDEARKTVIIRDRKDPRKKKGNDQEIPLLGESWDIVQRQPRTSDRIFPYNVSTVSKTFTKACQALSIPDLHLHDMRHECASQLAEAGWTIPEIAAVTGHKNWQNLKRYTQIDPSKLHDKQR